MFSWRNKKNAEKKYIIEAMSQPKNKIFLFENIIIMTKLMS